MHVLRMKFPNLRYIYKIMYMYVFRHVLYIYCTYIHVGLMLRFL